MSRAKKGIGILILWLAVLVCCAALGDPSEKQKNDTHQADVWALEALLNSGHPLGEDENEPNGGWPAPFVIAAPALDGSGTWRINDNFYGRTLDHSIFTISAQDTGTADFSMIYYKNYTGNIYTFTGGPIVSGGWYRVSIWYYFTNGSYGYNEYDFYIADDSSHTSLVEKITQVAAACKASTPWQTALNLHDWLINHAYYDQSQTYYGADILLRGTGTGDAYAKAYLLLCRAAGINAARITGKSASTGAGHAWNAIYVDGAWYYVDACWDDPEGSTAASSGKENHDYFCLNQDLISLDHTDSSSYTGLCISLDANYHVRTGMWDGIGNLIHGNPGLGRYSTRIMSRIEAGKGYGTVVIADKYFISATESFPADGTRAIRGWTLLAYGMSRDGIDSTKYGQKVLVKVSYDRSAKAFNYQMIGFKGDTGGTLTLPESLTALTDEMFKGVPANTLVVPAACTSAADTAIQGSQIHTIIFMGKDLTINKAFFNGINPLLVLCQPGSALETKLDGWGILHSIP